MTESSLPERRAFLGRLAAGAVALGLTGTVSKAFAAERLTAGDIKPSDKWLQSVTGKHRQFFDMPAHQNGMGLLHVRNYLNTLRDTYHVNHPDATAVVGLYGGTTLLGFNDAMWKKYGIGNVLKAMDGANAPATANIFYTAPAGAASLSITGAPIPVPADTSISALQQRGAVFILCNNAFNLWMGLLGGAKSAELRTEFEANMLPGIFLVPAMVVAVNQAQTHGCTYMYL
ncbi:MAG TPA: twin-arginine translocation signal domain-containing protein [Gemmatimonadaceae bacterium]|nr:twin-arginine translocation signal domain-containing protein [Gemmatimonadaceae bacterium]